MQLAPEHWRVLRAVASGQRLMSHRDVDGGKGYRLHPLAGPAEPVAWEVVAGLQAAGLIDSNKKFPAATYWLTEAGRDRLRGPG